jgi:hypothetical protein
MGALATFFGKVFGTDAAIKETISAVRDGMDALVYTEEEKAVDAAKDRSEARAMVVQWMEATQGQNLARRFLSMTITGVWLGMYVWAQFCMTVGIFVPDHYALRINAAGALSASYAEGLNGAVMLILAFYFAAPHMGDLAKVAMSRFSRTVEESK